MLHLVPTPRMLAAGLRASGAMLGARRLGAAAASADWAAITLPNVVRGRSLHVSGFGHTSRMRPALGPLSGSPSQMVGPSALALTCKLLETTSMPSALLGGCRHASARLTALKARSQLLFKKREPKPIPDKKWNIYARDHVVVHSGPYMIGEGKVKKVLRKENKVIVEGVNIKEKAEPDMDGSRLVAKYTRTEEPVHYSQVNLVDPVDGKRTRIRRGYLEDGTRVRVARRSGAVIERTQYTAKTTHEQRLAKPLAPFATDRKAVLEKTYVPPF